MGVRYILEDEGRAAEMMTVIDALEASFLEGALPEDVIS
jgi:hypothetical protein